MGAAGRHLNHAIKMLQLKEEEFAIINTVKCRPPENRKPYRNELKACRKFLDQQIAALSPQLIVLMGATALNVFFPGKRITDWSGKRIERNFYALFHPSVVNYGKQADKFWMDVEALGDYWCSAYKRYGQRFGVEPDTRQMTLEAFSGSAKA